MNTRIQLEKIAARKESVLRIFLLPLAFFLFTVSLPACSSHDDRHTTHEQVITTHEDGKVTKREVSETSVHAVEDVDSDDQEETGILGSFVGFLGDVIALPFRAVAGLVDLIF